MKHLTEEELIEHYYGEDFYKAEAEGHLQSCSECAQAYEELGKVLGSAKTVEPPVRGPEYGAQVWRAIEERLEPYPKRAETRERRGWRGFFRMPQLAYATACLVFVVAAFVAGRMWEQKNRPVPVAGIAQPSKERVVLFVLDGHLDRSERLLVQLNHAGGQPGEMEKVDLPLRGEAQQLLTDNRLYRQSVARNNDPSLNAALDHLERVLLEVANAPDQLSSADVARIEQEMNTQGLLFQIRVLRTRVSGQQRHAQTVRKGVSL